MEIVALGTLQLLAFSLYKMDMLLRLRALGAVNGVSFLFEIVQRVDVVPAYNIVSGNVLSLP